ATREGIRAALSRSLQPLCLCPNLLLKFLPRLVLSPLSEIRRQSRLSPLQPYASLLSSPGRPLPATPALPRTHHTLRKTSICDLPQSANISDDAGTLAPPQTCESRGTAAKPSLFPPHRS